MLTKYNIKSGDILCRVCVDQHRYFKPTHHVFLPKPNQNISTALSQHIAENVTRGSFKVQHIANVFWRITGVSRVHPLGARKSLKDFVVIHPVEIVSRKREKKVFPAQEKRYKITRVGRIHPLGSTNACTEFHVSPSSGCFEIFPSGSKRWTGWHYHPQRRATSPTLNHQEPIKKKPKKQVTKKKKPTMFTQPRKRIC